MRFLAAGSLVLCTCQAYEIPTCIDREFLKCVIWFFFFFFFFFLFYVSILYVSVHLRLICVKDI